MIKRRLVEVFIMLVIGKGIVIALYPQWHVQLWQFDSPAYRKAVNEFSRRPLVTRAVGALTAILGIALAMEQNRR